MLDKDKTKDILRDLGGGLILRRSTNAFGLLSVFFPRQASDVMPVA